MSEQNHAPDLPLGLGMALAMNTDALNYFGSLKLGEQENIVKYIQSAQSGREAKQRIHSTVEGLKNHDLTSMSM